MVKYVSQTGAFAFFFLATYWFLTISPNQVHILFSTFLAALLIWLCIVDLDRFEIPDLSVLLIMGGGIAFQYQSGWEATLWAILAGLIVVTIMYLISITAERMMQKPALGLGDVKLLGASAIWVGFKGINSVILLASLSGVLFVGAAFFLFKRPHNTPIPFGPFIALGVWIVWLIGPIV